MARETRGLQSIRTMAAMLDQRRARTPAGALLELSAMANEKLLLEKELARWKRRHAEIQTRLGDIAKKERRLLAFVQDPASSPLLPTSHLPNPAVASAAQAGSAATTAGRLRMKEISY